MSESVTEKEPPWLSVLAQDLFYTFAVMRILHGALGLKLSLRLNQIKIQSRHQARKNAREQVTIGLSLCFSLVEKVARISLMTNHMAQQRKIKECEITLDTQFKTTLNPGQTAHDSLNL